MKARFSITLDKELVKKIDKKRNDIPRSLYLNKLLRKCFKMNNQINLREKETERR